ncbi:hypothetical protein CUMW_033130 [Citrus unshiu]|nr:hypothetical protein CUMW_033130 [Citrus unshiu]
MSMRHGKIIPIILRIQTREPWHASRPSVNFERSVQGQLVPTSNKKKSHGFCSLLRAVLEALTSKENGRKKAIGRSFSAAENA